MEQNGAVQKMVGLAMGDRLGIRTVLVWRKEGGRMPSVLGWRNGWALYQPVNWSQQCSSFLLAPHSERQNTDEKEK